MDTGNPFPGAAELAYKPKVKQKKKSRKQRKAEARQLRASSFQFPKELHGMIGDVLCTCGAHRQYNCLVSYLHNDKCNVNTRKK